MKVEYSASVVLDKLTVRELNKALAAIGRDETTQFTTHSTQVWSTTNNLIQANIVNSFPGVKVTFTWEEEYYDTEPNIEEDFG